jgi:integrase
MDRHAAIAREVAAQGRYSGEATANAAMRVARLLFNFAADRDASLGRNPVRLRRAWFKVARRERYVSEAELPRFYKAVCALDNPVQRDYLLLLLFTGLRRREAASLTWDDVDLSAGVLHISPERTKAGRRLDLPMSSLVRDLLVARRALGRDSFIFPANSASGHLEEPKLALQQVADACGVRVSAHDLRRTFVTVAEATEMSPLALKALVNHALGNDVTAGYVQMTVERLRAPAQRVADRLRALLGLAPDDANVARLRG